MGSTMIAFACSGCSSRLKVSDASAGKTARCPKCGQHNRVPAPQPSLVSATELAPTAAPMSPRTDATVPPRVTLADGDATVDYRPGEAQVAPSVVGLPRIEGYEVLQELGRGGMGVVYKARQLRPRRLVALKMILAADYAGSDHAVRFRAEAEAVARLQHPNIVQIHEVGDHQGHAFLTLEYLEGGTLATKLAGRQMSWKEAARLVETLARAVDHAHQKGIVHRDLKPSNVLYTAEGELKVVDFGLAKQVGEGSLAPAAAKTRTGAILGTPGYMAPEQASGKAVGPATDVYALGAILYEALTGRAPFASDNTFDTLLQVVREDPPPPRRFRPKLSRDLETICLKCLQKDPARRYASAGELAADLRAFLEGAPIKARRAGRLERFGRWVRRRKEIAYLVVGALAAACASLLVLGLWSRHAQKPSLPTTTPKITPDIAKSDVAERFARLPEDLRFVPPDAVAFVSMRVGDVWVMETTREKPKPPPLPPRMEWMAVFYDINKLGELMKEYTSVHPRDVDRATLVVLDEPTVPVLEAITRVGPPERQVLGIVLQLSRPCDTQKVLDLFGQVGQVTRTSHGDRTVYTATFASELGPALCFVHDRLVLMSISRSAMHRFLDRHDNPAGNRALLQRTSAAGVASRDETGIGEAPRLGALERAAESHHVVAAVAPPRRLLRELPNQGQILDVRDLLRLESVVLVLDQQREGKGMDAIERYKLNLTATYDDAKQAGLAREAANRLLARGVASVETSLSPVMPPSLLARLLAPLRGEPVQVEGRELRLPYQVEFSTKEIMSWTSAVQQSAAETVNRNNLWQLALALHDYHSRIGHLPAAASYSPDGKPLLSWRVAILPYIGQESLHKQFKLDEPWDSPHNIKLLDRMPRVFAVPDTSGPRAFTGVKGEPVPTEKNATHFQVFVGPGAAFDGNKGLPLVGFTPGTSNVILIAEAGEPVLWTKPADLPFAPDKPLPKLGNWFGKGFQTAMADGHVRTWAPKPGWEEDVRQHIRRESGK
jgi:hypothetical protein